MMENPNNMSYQKTIRNILQNILTRFKERDIEVDVNLVVFAVQLLARDMRLGITKCDLNNLTACTINRFIDDIISGYTDPKNTTMANLKMIWLMKTTREIKLSYVQEKYEQIFQQQLQLLIQDILQYPENCSKVQLDQLFAKMQVLIVVCYNLGCPKNHVLLKLTAQALNSVIGRTDLQNYVLKKKYHRLEYLKRLAATVSGIVIYHNDGPDGDRENVRYVIGDLMMAQKNTSEAIETTLKRLHHLRSICHSVISEQLDVDTRENIIVYRVPLEKLQWLNQYSITFSIQERCLRLLQENFESTAYLLNRERERYDCVVAKINETLVMRTAIESELVFPHFVYLGEVWNNLNNYLNHIVELNKLREQLEPLVTNEIEEAAKSIAKEIHALGQRQKYPQKRTILELMDAVKDYKTEADFCSIAQTDVKECCALTLAMTNGLLLPATIEHNICTNVDIKFGFRDKSYLRVAEIYFEKFINSFRKVVFTNANVALLFNLADAMIAHDLYRKKPKPAKSKDFNGQTEMVVTNDLSVPNWINVTWNVWDYHRDTIHKAEIRKRQTHDSQTKISFGRRNAQNQTYNTRQHY
ncbi:cilia- and flagella-associated protein 206 [Scaptodrosophila lebanonensis]|uniref:Cilia- and flagella-associated protein 206 n=1 Tax=Drosophila lebanonensis TaxID=7225 RepID=A0A6J2TVP9_DROLE|nr:cilia- and flagella-associated protein 206 [Scaptodrosophila lebanonensis]